MTSQQQCRCPICGGILIMFEDNSGAICEKKHFATNVRSDVE